MALITLTAGNDTAPPPSIAPGDTVLGLTGNDTITAPSNSEVYGNQGDDVLTGGGTGVTLYGGQDNDTLRSVSTSVLFGDKGNDSLFSVFADTMYGGIGQDTLIVAPNSAAFGGQDNDLLLALTSGAPGATLAGDKGNDIIKGAGTGGSLLYGDDVTLTLTGDTGAGDDTIWAYGQDTAFGGAGNDSLVSFGAKIMFGNQGNDNLSIAKDFTGLTSGAGISLYGGQGDDTITGYKGGALLSGDKGNDFLIATEEGTVVDTLVGGAGNDSLRGTSQKDILIGGASSLPGLDTAPGNDLIDGRNGNDTIIAGAGGSVISGGQGEDSIIGGAGADSILGGDDNDTIIAGAGNDSLQGWKGNDILTGGAGADSFIFVGGTFATSAFFTSADGISSIARPENPTQIRDRIGLDSITDFQTGIDKIVLDGKGVRFTGVGLTDPNQGLFEVLSTDQAPGVAIINVTSAGATNPDDATIRAVADQSSGLLVYNIANGSLWYNANATTTGGDQQAVQFLWLQPGITNLSSQDFIIV